MHRNNKIPRLMLHNNYRLLATYGFRLTTYRIFYIRVQNLSRTLWLSECTEIDNYHRFI